MRLRLLLGLIWLGACSCVETAGAVAETAAQRFSAAPTVLTIEQEENLANAGGSEFTECAVACPLMVVIPAGKSTIGSSEDEPGRTKERVLSTRCPSQKPLPLPSTRLRLFSGMPVWRLLRAPVSRTRGVGKHARHQCELGGRQTACGLAFAAH
jgi:hypothetical protein